MEINGKEYNDLVLTMEVIQAPGNHTYTQLENSLKVKKDKREKEKANREKEIKEKLWEEKKSKAKEEREKYRQRR